MNVTEQLLEIYPSSDAKCAAYGDGVAAEQMIQDGIRRGELEAAAGGTAIGICATEMRGRRCNGTFVLEEGQEIVHPASCVLRGLREARTMLPTQPQGENTPTQAAAP